MVPVYMCLVYCCLFTCCRWGTAIWNQREPIETRKPVYFIRSSPISIVDNVLVLQKSCPLLSLLYFRKYICLSVSHVRYVHLIIIPLVSLTMPCVFANWMCWPLEEIMFCEMHMANIRAVVQQLYWILLLTSCQKATAIYQITHLCL